MNDYLVDISNLIEELITIDTIEKVQDKQCIHTKYAFSPFVRALIKKFQYAQDHSYDCIRDEVFASIYQAAIILYKKHPSLIISKDNKEYMRRLYCYSVNIIKKNLISNAMCDTDGTTILLDIINESDYNNESRSFEDLTIDNESYSSYSNEISRWLHDEMWHKLTKKQQQYILGEIQMTPKSDYNLRKKIKENFENI